MSSEKLRWELFIVDDGSTDGTREAIQEWSNSATSHFSLLTSHLIAGSGNLYWAKGMALAWREALKYESTHHSSTSTFDFDSFLWLNDDTILYPDSISHLLTLSPSHPSSVIVGSLVDADGCKTYGVNDKGEFSGNCVLVPRAVYETIGCLDGGFSHAWADVDYSLRCRESGIGIVDAGPVGQAEGHPMRPALKRMNLCDRLRSLRDPKGWCLHDVWRFRLRHDGLLRACFSCVHIVFHVIRGKD